MASGEGINSEQCNQPHDILLPRCPARRDAHDGCIVLFFPKAHRDVWGEVRELWLIVLVFFGFPSRERPVLLWMDDVLSSCFAYVDFERT